MDVKSDSENLRILPPLKGEALMTLDEVGQIMGISRGRVQQLERSAFQKIGKRLRRRLGEEFLSAFMN